MTLPNYTDIVSDDGLVYIFWYDKEGAVFAAFDKINCRWGHNVRGYLQFDDALQANLSAHWQNPNVKEIYVQALHTLEAKKIICNLQLLSK